MTFPRGFASSRLISCSVAAAAIAAAIALPGCGNRTIRLDIVPTEAELEPRTVENDGDMFTTDKVAIVTVSGLIADAHKGSLLTSGYNPVSEFRKTLDDIAKDDSVKAVLLRINSPGGTVAASQMMYTDLMAFKAKTHKPVVVCMMDLCASGGYYLSCAGDYRIAYTTTITGSIGVIMETININGTLKKIGVATESVKSAENKDMGSPFKPAADPDHPLSDNDRELLQGIVNQFYAGFQDVVRHSPNHIKEENWKMLTDGRVVTGKDAVGYGLIDETGTLDTAIAKAKEMAHISKAKIVAYSRDEDAKDSIYATAPNGGPTVNMLNINLDLGDVIPRGESQFLYLWTGFGGDE